LYSLAIASLQAMQRLGRCSLISVRLGQPPKGLTFTRFLGPDVGHPNSVRLERLVRFAFAAGHAVLRMREVYHGWGVHPPCSIRGGFSQSLGIGVFCRGPCYGRVISTE